MKRKSFVILLIVTAVLAAALTLLTKDGSALTATMFAFPFEQIAAGLGALARAGRWGNAAALTLWVALAALPAGFALAWRRDALTRAEKAAMLALSGLLLAGFYAMVNPWTFLSDWLAGNPDAAASVRVMFGATLWSGVVFCVMLRIVRSFRSSGRAQLLRALKLLLRLLCVGFVASTTVVLVRGGVTLGDDSLVGADKCVLLLRLAAELLATLLTVGVLLRALALIAILESEEQAGLAEAAEGLSRLCCKALIWPLGLAVLSNALSVLALRFLTDVSVTAELPVTQLALVLIVLLLDRLLFENKRLREDNDLFI